MAGKKGQSGIGALINGAGFLLAVLLVLHIVFVLTGFPAENGLASSVAQAAEPLALFFPGLVPVRGEFLQVLVDYGLAAAFWVLLCGVLARVFG
ncbi:hypothetical protein [Saccharopolyspora sp. 5N708]|uniref:hypothetical protein n=1 Tax=Saccharopolyspora sp. 5N708 TaxID=3457424 RepID=UPI003FD25FA0